MSYIMTLTGPSCSGKSHLQQALIAARPDIFAKLMSVTTRDPRPGEQGEDGRPVEYKFVRPFEFEAMIQQGQMAQYTRFDGKWYGTTVADLKAILGAGKVPVVVVEPGGVAQFRSVGEPLGAFVFAVYVNATADVLVGRWLERARAESADRLPVTTRRLLKCLGEEMDWDELEQYSLHIKEYGPETQARVVGTLSEIVAKSLDRRVTLSAAL